MDRYESVIGRLVGKLNRRDPYAITLGQVTYYSCPESQVDARWRRHEDEHKVQWQRDGWVKFACRYVWWSITKGYANNPYELDAVAAEELV